MEQRVLCALMNALTNVDRPAGVEIATLTRYDIPALTVLTLDAYGDPTTAGALLETSKELRLTFNGAFSSTTEDFFIGTWDGGTLVGTILVVRESPWDSAPDGPFVVDLVIDPEYRCRGVATVLITEVASRCEDQGFDSLVLRINGRHSGTAELYDNLGFKEVGWQHLSAGTEDTKRGDGSA